jgi:inorganic pyrophosphatase
MAPFCFTFFWFRLVKVTAYICKQPIAKMKQFFTTALISLLLVSITSCKTDYADLPTYSNSRQLQAVIEVPAGTSYKIRYNRETKEFVNDKEAGLNRMIRFLPYPGNYGFIPSTELEKGGQGLGVFIIAESVATGTVMDITPVATLLLHHENGDLDAIVIAVPARPSQQLINATDFTSLSQKYPAVKDIIQKWFTNYHPTSQTKVAGWKDEQFAEKEIQRWMKL